MSKPRFNDYRSIAAKFSSAGTCGHPIKAGDLIGCARRGRDSFTQCRDCWHRWQAENEEADRLEYSSSYGGY